MPSTNFIRTRRLVANFENAMLLGSNFSSANVKNAKFDFTNLTMVDFTLANLQDLDFRSTRISNEQLISALSIQDARLRNGTLGQDRRLAFHTDSTKCRFALQSDDTDMILSQSINLADFWNSDLWPYSFVTLNVRTGVNVSIQLNGVSSNGKISSQIISSTYLYLLI